MAGSGSVATVKILYCIRTWKMASDDPTSEKSSSKSSLNLSEGDDDDRLVPLKRTTCDTTLSIVKPASQESVKYDVKGRCVLSAKESSSSTSCVPHSDPDDNTPVPLKRTMSKTDLSMSTADRQDGVKCIVKKMSMLSTTESSSSTSCVPHSDPDDNTPVSLKRTTSKTDLTMSTADRQDGVKYIVKKMSMLSTTESSSSTSCVPHSDVDDNTPVPLKRTTSETALCISTPGSQEDINIVKKRSILSSTESSSSSASSILELIGFDYTPLKRTTSDIALTTSKYKLDRKDVKFSVKGPITIPLGDEEDFHPGASAVDILFNTPSEVGEIFFRNFYTAWISVYVCYAPETSSGNKKNDKGEDIFYSHVPSKTVVPSTLVGFRPHGRQETIAVSLTEVSGNQDIIWTLAIKKKQLMPQPHREIGSQDCFSVSVKESSLPWRNLVAMRLILRQPSTVWAEFYIEEIHVYSDMLHQSEPKSVACLPHLHDTYYDHLELLKYQTKTAMMWKRYPRPEPKKPATPSPKKKSKKRMTDIQKEKAAKAKARKQLHGRYEVLLKNVKGCYEVEANSDWCLKAAKTKRRRYTL